MHQQTGLEEMPQYSLQVISTAHPSLVHAFTLTPPLHQGSACPFPIPRPRRSRQHDKDL